MFKKQVRRKPLVGSIRLKIGKRKSQAQEKFIKNPRVNNSYSESTKPYRPLRMSKKLDRKIEAPVPISTVTDDDKFKSTVWNK